LEYFLNYTHDLDKLRNQSLKESVSELWQHLENYFENIGGNITNFKGKLNE
jgi:hypothetical protein